MTQYLLECSTWSVGGLLLGYVLGKIERNVLSIKKKVAPDDDDS